MKPSFVHICRTGLRIFNPLTKHIFSMIDLVKRKALLAVVIVIVLSACLPQPAEPTPTPDIEIRLTEGAQTMIAYFTMEAAATAIAGMTETARVADQQGSTQASPSTPAPVVSATPILPTSTPLPPTPPPTPVPCDQAIWVGDVTVPLDTVLPSGARFKKTWRVLNAGTCTWTTDYSIIFSGGDRMGDISVYSLPTTVNPGEAADLSASLKLSDFTGTYQSEWMLRNPSGVTFGIGSDGKTPLQVRVISIASQDWGEGSLDFAADYCVATWRSGTAALSCPGNSADANGSAIMLSQATLENGLSNQYVLWTRPNQNPNGQIKGIYPLYRVRQNDHFLSQIGCLSQSTNCDLMFYLEFQTTDGISTYLGSWREVLDGYMTEIDINLAQHVGKTGNFILTVENLGSAQAANAIWRDARIQSQEPSSSLILIWEYEGRQEDSCDRLEITFSGTGMAQARATYCEDRDEMIVTGPLTVNEMAQLLEWMGRLSKFQAEVYQASPVRPLISWIEFNGRGNSTARDVDIQAVNNFAAQLFQRFTGLR